MFSSEDYRALYEAAPDGFAVVDADGTVREANPKLLSLFGWTREELVGTSVEVLVPEAHRSVHRDHRGRFMGSPHDRPMGAGLDLRGQRKDGSTFPVEISLSPWEYGDGSVRVICTVRDMTAQRRLQNFSEGAMRATEDERQRIARELHDDTAQRLATLLLRVRALAEEADPAARHSLWEAVREEIVEAAEGVTRISRGLRPPELEEVGLVLAIHAHIRNLRERAGFEVENELDAVDPFLDITAKLALYRIIQEALSNARRHAGAGRARVSLTREEGAVIAEVADPGAGFVPTGASEGNRGLGLVGMRERATMIGGRLTIDSAPGAGTRVRVTIPINMEITDG